MRAMAALVTLSAFGGCMIGMLTGTRVIAAMGADGAFAPSLARVGPAGTPDRAIAVTASLALAYALSPFVGRFAEVFVVGAWPFYALGALATIVPDDQLPVKQFSALLDRVVKTIAQAPDDVRLAMNGPDERGLLR